MYDIIIVGAGPAGLTAALYARRAEKQVLIIEKESFGGQMTHSPRIENYPGFVAVSGNELADKLIEQVLAQGAEVELDTVVGIEGEGGAYRVICEGTEYEGKTVIIATGATHRSLGIEGEEELVGHGISYCAVCDGAFYKGKSVAVIGGGNSALVDAVMLSESCSRVIVVQNLPYFTGEERLLNILKTKNNVELITSSVVKEFTEDNGELGGVVIRGDDGDRMLYVDGVFVAIGQKPENEAFSEVVRLSEQGYVVSDESCVPSGAREGIFVAGDCRTKTVRQVATATADGAISALAACRYLDNLKVK